MDLQLRGKVAIVTGASRGIGRAITELLFEEGMRVAVVARSRDQLMSLAGPKGNACLVHAADLMHPDTPAAVVDATVKLSHEALAGTLFKSGAFDQLLQAGKVSVDGDAESFKTFIGLLDDFDPFFNIIAPV